MAWVLWKNNVTQTLKEAQNGQLLCKTSSIWTVKGTHEIAYCCESITIFTIKAPYEIIGNTMFTIEFLQGHLDIYTSATSPLPMQ